MTDAEAASQTPGTGTALRALAFAAAALTGVIGSLVLLVDVLVDDVYGGPTRGTTVTAMVCLFAASGVSYLRAVTNGLPATLAEAEPSPALLRTNPVALRLGAIILVAVGALGYFSVAAPWSTAILWVAIPVGCACHVARIAVVQWTTRSGPRALPAGASDAAETSA